LESSSWWSTSQSTGCFNATKLCNDGGKQYRDWTRLTKSQRLIEYYESRREKSRGGFYEVKGDNKDALVAKTTGQYVRKELILDIASWVSVEFYDKIESSSISTSRNTKRNWTIIVSLLSRKMTRLMKHLKESDRKREEADRKREESDKRHANMIRRLEESNKRLGIKLDDVLDKNDELLERNETIETRVVSIQTKLDIAVEDRAPQPDRVEAREHFILLKRNDEDYPYYTIRALARYRFAREARREAQPNSKTLYVRIKDDLRARGVAFRYCKISIEPKPNWSKRCARSTMKNVESIELLPHVVTTRADKNDFTSLDRVKRKMASLNDVCFERIRDTFYYGMFGEFKLVVDKSTGCFNATKLCKDGGKKFRNWTCLEKSKRLIEYYEISRQNSGGYFYEVAGGNNSEAFSKTTGQYVRKELILDIASWFP
jgi:hypothetical protein